MATKVYKKRTGVFATSNATERKAQKLFAKLDKRRAVKFGKSKPGRTVRV